MNLEVQSYSTKQRLIMVDLNSFSQDQPPSLKTSENNYIIHSTNIYKCA